MKPKWLYEKNISCRIYNRHPDTGNRNFQGAYVYVIRYSEQSLIKLFIEREWTYLGKDRHYLVFAKLVKNGD